MSPRFYGQGLPPYYGKPDDVSKDLIYNLEKGMQNLVDHCKKRGPLNPAAMAVQNPNFD